MTIHTSARQLIYTVIQFGAVFSTDPHGVLQVEVPRNMPKALHALLDEHWLDIVCELWTQQINERTSDGQRH